MIEIYECEVSIKWKISKLYRDALTELDAAMLQEQRRMDHILHADAAKKEWRPRSTECEKVNARDLFY